MKKLIAVLVFFSLGFVYEAFGDMNYVSIDGKTYFSDEVKVGSNNLRITTDEGLTLKAPLKKVDAYMVNGRLYERLPLICAKGKNRGNVLMEFVSQRNDLRLYKYCTQCYNPELGCRFYDKSNQESVYFLYQNGELYLRIDNKNAATVLPFFHVTYKEKI